jgi:uncharacterized phage-associated protein
MAAVSVFDVAARILAKTGKITTMKLQKLCYYSQGYSLAWDGVPLFREPIQAWANGPVVFDLWKQHRRQFNIDLDDIPDGNPDALSPDQAETVDAVLAAYGHLSGHELSVKTHTEPPWVDARARAGADAGMKCAEEISLDDMQIFFDTLIADL